jgi:hypothetical protein
MPSSGMLRRVALVRTNVSEELSASIISVTGIGELGSCHLDDGDAKFIRNSVFTRGTRGNIPEDAILQDTTCESRRRWY